MITDAEACREARAGYPSPATLSTVFSDFTLFRWHADPKTATGQGSFPGPLGRSPNERPPFLVRFYWKPGTLTLGQALS